MKTALNSKRLMPLAAILAMLFLAPGAANAQTPQRTSATYGDWTLSCAVAANGSKSCGLIHLVKQGNVAAAQISFGRSSKSGHFTATVQIAANVWLATGLKIAFADDTPALSAPFEWCLSVRCLAEFDLVEADVKRLRSQKEPARVVYKNALQTDMTLPMTFVGFDDAVNALEKQ
ncbi:MAG TPA: invasion associated locus B family protein [Xanthobacteraceae bacterium]|nr:invasion associated locus B family protein [Xanthobacteraceae bacterium]